MPRLSDEVQMVVDNPGPWMIWLYGDHGAGKTVLGAGFPNVFLADTEGSRRSLLNHPELVRTPFIAIESFGKFKNLVDEIILGQAEVFQNAETIQIDTVSTLQMKDLNQQMKDLARNPNRNHDLPSQAEFNINNTRIRKSLLELKERSGKNIILISHIKEEQDNEGTTILIRPGNSPSLSRDIAFLCDGIFYLTSRTDSKGETTRTLKCMSGTKFWAKNRFSSTLTKEIVNPTAKDVQKAIDEQLELARQYAEKEKIEHA
jgi:hypothetical protein